MRIETYEIISRGFLVPDATVPPGVACFPRHQDVSGNSAESAPAEPCMLIGPKSRLWCIFSGSVLREARMVLASVLASGPPTAGCGSVLHSVGQICVFPRALPKSVHPGGLKSRICIKFLHLGSHSCMLDI